MWLGQSHTGQGTCTTLLTVQSLYGRSLIGSGIFDSVLCCLGDMIKLLLGFSFLSTIWMAPLNLIFKKRLFCDMVLSQNWQGKKVTKPYRQLLQLNYKIFAEGSIILPLWLSGNIYSCIFVELFLDQFFSVKCSVIILYPLFTVLIYNDGD